MIITFQIYYIILELSNVSECNDSNGPAAHLFCNVFGLFSTSVPYLYIYIYGFETV